MQNKTKYLAEFIGTMLLVFLGCGSAVLAGDYVGNLGIAFAFGLTVLAMVYAIGPVSGCHINPAITVSMWVTGKLNKVDALFYILAQLLGAVVGAWVLYLIASGGIIDAELFTLGSNGYGALSPAGYSLGSAIAAEIVLTAVFLFVICAVVSRADNAAFAGLAIGLTLTIIHIVGIPVTGVSVNPARSFGPALVLGLTLKNWAFFSQLGVFILAPIVGGLIGAIGWKCVNCACEAPAKKK